MAKESIIKNKITKDTFIPEILEYPKAMEILAKYNLPCLGCPMAAFELGRLRLGEVCKMYEIDFEKLLEELNGVISGEFNKE
ncbi:MAG: hypothetical protein COX43_02695 [Parcubacteria group bacterium CG23_combo_of_CG06-09_8_20_14_all_35_9]|nr:MAG: hypothetical protein COX43_02695 [Parcubacteria group bacterium CG23_combo_of_CG06-09_8_20_14_all_35_9]